MTIRNIDTLKVGTVWRAGFEIRDTTHFIEFYKAVQFHGILGKFVPYNRSGLAIQFVPDQLSDYKSIVYIENSNLCPHSTWSYKTSSLIHNSCDVMFDDEPITIPTHLLLKHLK